MRKSSTEAWHSLDFRLLGCIERAPVGLRSQELLDLGEHSADAPRMSEVDLDGALDCSSGRTNWRNHLEGAEVADDDSLGPRGP